MPPAKTQGKFNSTNACTFKWFSSCDNMERKDVKIGNSKSYLTVNRSSGSNRWWVVICRILITSPTWWVRTNSFSFICNWGRQLLKHPFQCVFSFIKNQERTKRLHYWYLKDCQGHVKYNLSTLIEDNIPHTKGCLIHGRSISMWNNLAFECIIYCSTILTSEGRLFEKRQRNHSVVTRETSNSKASKWVAILHFHFYNFQKILRNKHTIHS